MAQQEQPQPQQQQEPTVSGELNDNVLTDVSVEGEIEDTDEDEEIKTLELKEHNGTIDMYEKEKLQQHRISQSENKSEEPAKDDSNSKV
jgi:hypothetical protein